MSKLQPTRFGKYLLLEKIATGGMAQLYRAKIIGVEGFEKLIAIKMILPHLAVEKELVGSFIDEAKLAALLHHQNIVQIYDFGTMENSYFICMEYLLGKDLRHILQKSKEKRSPLSIEHSVYIASRVVSGLDYAHKLKDFQGKPLNIIHRDISPQNVFITYEGEVKIVDFGIAKAASQSTITQYGMIKGKVAYMSPEQASGDPIDHRSDIFSTGILLYEMLTHKRMFIGDTLQILDKVRRAEFEPPEAAASSLPTKFYKVLHQALVKEPERRYQSCGDMLADLEECMFELSLRPNVRGLAHYMKELFAEEIDTEGGVMHEVATIGGDRELPREGTMPIAEEGLKEPRAPIVEQAARKPKKQGILYAAITLSLVVVCLVVAIWYKQRPVSAPERESVQPSVSEPSKKSAPAVEAKALIDRAAALIPKDPDEAKSLLLKAIALDPRSVQGHFQLGRAYTKLKNSPKAIEAYQKVTELDPRSADAYFNLGYAYASTGDYSKAEEMYALVVKLAPPYLDEALFNLGIVQEKLGKRMQSIENLKRALVVNPKNEKAREFLHRLKRES